MKAQRLLLQALRNPETVVGLQDSRMEDLMVVAERSRLTATLGHRLDDAGILAELPGRVRSHFEAAMTEARFRNRLIRWEMNRVARALRPLDVTVVALKGAAYLLLDLPLARGRLPADLDILVRREDLSRVERRLTEAGWRSAELSEYDQRYYRRWMHEIPPLRHPRRYVEVDVHHALLPLTARLRANDELLWSSVREVSCSRFRVLAPEDLVLHAVVHLFHDSDCANRLRDLVDIDGLLRHFGARDRDFWRRLTERARAHGLEGPLTYAFHVSRRLLHTPVPVEWLNPGGTNPLPRRWVTALMCRALPPSAPDDLDLGAAAARWLLYLRSHYLRMPLKLLIPHLLRKALAGKRH